MSQDTLKLKLLQILLDNAKKLPQAGSSGNVTDIQALQSVLLGAAKGKFLQSYQVPYNGNATKPKDLAVGKDGDVRGTSAIYYLPDNNPSSLKIFMETNIFSAIELTRPDVKFAAQPAYTSLEKELQDKLLVTTGNNWSSSTFSQTYDNPETNKNSLRTISVMFYVNAELREGALTAKMKFISYLGVYYHVPPPNPPKNIPQDLQQILNDYAKFKFKGTYSVDYEGNNTKPKDLIPAGLTTWKLSSILNTLLIQTNVLGDLENMIRIQIMPRLDIPEWLKGIVFVELEKVFDAARKASLGSIQSTKSSQVYKDPINTQGYPWKSLAIVTFTNDVASDGGPGTFISFLGVFYPIKSIPA